MNDVIAFLRDAFSQPAVRALAFVVGALALAKIVDIILCRVLRSLAGRTRSDLDDRLIDQLHRPIFFSVVALGLYLALVELGPPYVWLFVRVIKTFVALIWASALLRVCSELIRGLGRLADRVHWLDARTVPLFDNLAKLAIVGLALYSMLVIWSLDVKPWLASAGIVGIAISLSAKDTLANLFGGLFLIMDGPYKLGDFINLDSGERGQVTKIGLRSTRLLTRDDVEITLPNAAVANAKIVNESGGRWEKSRVSITAGVAYGSDVDQVREVLVRAASSVDHVINDPEPRIQFIEMGDSALIFRVMCWIEAPVLRGACIDGLNSAVYKALNEAGISIPFPQRDVHVRQPLHA